MSTALPEIPKNLDLSKLATKYGPVDEGPFKGTGKSGFTPVSPWVDGTAKSPRSWKIRKRIERWQGRMFYGFTARELNSLGALSAFQNPMPNNLTNELHPLFRLDRWLKKEELPLHRPAYPLPKGHEGFWEAHNPVVWAVLEPCLRLASMFIDNFHIWSWWDTWLFGELSNIEDEPFRETGKWLQRVHQREPETIFAEENALREAFLTLSENLRLSIAHGITLPSDGLPMANIPSSWIGMTVFDKYLDREMIYLDYKMLSQLLINDLTTAEIAVAQFHVAKVLVHEMAHALWRLDSDRNQWTHGEPYFEDEGVAEGGESLTTFIFRGECIPFETSNYLAGFWSSTWPTINSFGGLGNPAIGILPSIVHVYPVPIEYLERISQKEFWDYYVPRFGLEALRFSPLTYGCTVRLEQDYYRIVKEENAWEYLPQMPTEGPMSPEVLKSIEVENKRRRTAERAIKSLEDTRIQEQAADRAVLENLLGGTIEAGSLEEWSQPGKPLYLPQEPAEENHREPRTLLSDLDSLPEPTRFQEIRNFLFEGGEVLALRTLFTPIPENTLLAYINRVGVITLTQEELREFLTYCVHGLDILFCDLQIRSNNFASVRVSDEGWPDRRVTSENEPPAPPEERIIFLIHFMVENGFTKAALTYETRFLDYDSEVIRALYNRNRGMNDYRPSLSKEEWDLLMEFCAYCRRAWTNGPPGIIRLLPPPPDQIRISSPHVSTPSNNYPEDDSNDELEERELAEGIEYESDRETQREEAGESEEGGMEEEDDDEPVGSDEGNTESEEGETEEEEDESVGSDEGNAEGDIGDSSDDDPSEFDLWASIRRQEQRRQNNRESPDDEDD